MSTIVRTPITLTSAQCQFTECIFQGSGSSSHFVFANDGGLLCSFVSCLFICISSYRSGNVVMISNAGELVIYRCCFYEASSFHIYGTGSASCYCVPRAFANSTTCSNCEANAPYLGGTTAFSFIYNNNTHLRDGIVNCCYHIHNLPNRDDVSSFFQGTSCTGNHPTRLQSDITGCILSKYSFVNNTDSVGYFDLFHASIVTTIKDSVIHFTSSNTSPAWLNSATSGAKLVIDSCYVIASGNFRSEMQVSTSNVERVDFASTFKYFPKQPMHKECNQASFRFTYSVFFWLIHTLITTTCLLLTLLQI